MSNTKAKIKDENMLSESFAFNKEDKKGDGLSVILFIITLHYDITDIDQRGTIFNKTNKYVLTLMMS